MEKEGFVRRFEGRSSDLETGKLIDSNLGEDNVSQVTD